MIQVEYWNLPPQRQATNAHTYVRQIQSLKARVNRKLGLKSPFIIKRPDQTWRRTSWKAMVGWWCYNKQ
ncbi:hypothetical protein OESDEN_06106 [Oesophagostomum dentatum]|uniref:Uncharacterized protein n=1 Tax=Oesophagostomum dentatum TaxID=61180 RepID=A0A0B1TDQ7_OESDE|nr:hypothetical protein OESDEN_06106 [Oesophagostomum dentatum]